MSKTKFTPGPWKIERLATNIALIMPALAEIDGALIATVNDDNDEMTAEMEANAHLITAAPDLYAACLAQEEAEDFNANSCPDCKDEGTEAPELCEHCFPYYDKARCMRRAAIAKATGGAQ